VLDAYDMSYDDMEADFLSYAEATDQMANGHIEAAFVTSGVPNPSLTELATNTDFIVVPIDAVGKDKLLDEYDFFIDDEIAGASFEHSEDVETVGVMNHLMSSSEFTEDAVYDITETFFDNLVAIHNSLAAAEDITLEDATEALIVPLYP